MGQGQCVPCPVEKPCNTRLLRNFADDEFEFADDSAVLLNIYDLNEEWLISNNILQEVLDLGGAFHAGVEVYGREWTFGSTGVFDNRPRSHDVHVYRQTIVIGYTNYSPEEVEAILEDEYFARWAGTSYDLFSKNCCSFARALCKRLTGNSIPKWVDRLPRFLNAITKPVKGVVGEMATGVGKSVNSAPVSQSFAARRDCSIESVDSNFSVATLATNLTTTSGNESLFIPRNDSFVIPKMAKDPSFHAPVSPVLGVAYGVAY